MSVSVCVGGWGGGVFCAKDSSVLVVFAAPFVWWGGQRRG